MSTVMGHSPKTIYKFMNKYFTKLPNDIQIKIMIYWAWTPDRVKNNYNTEIQSHVPLYSQVSKQKFDVHAKIENHNLNLRYLLRFVS